MGPRRHIGRGTALAIGLATLTLARPGAAAEVRWQAPAECDQATSVTERVEGLVGRELESVEGLDFAVTVTVTAGGTWELLLVTQGSGATASDDRKFVAKTCTAVSDAAAVAIAMTIRGAAPPGDEPATTASSTSAPVVEPARPPPPAQPSEPPPRPDLKPKALVLVGLGGLLDTATLPNTSFGLVALAGVRYTSFRFELQGIFLPPATADIGDGREAAFDLLAGAALVCLDRTLGNFSALGCGGYELGRLAGEGSGVSDPERESVLWQALRFEVGAGIPASDWLRFVARLGAAVPTTRSDFVLTGIPVHETPALTLRAAISVELTL